MLFGVEGEKKANGYHQGQVWNREQEEKKSGKYLVIKVLRDNFEVGGFFNNNFGGFFSDTLISNITYEGFLDAIDYTAALNEITFSGRHLSAQYQPNIGAQQFTFATFKEFDIERLREVSMMRYLYYGYPLFAMVSNGVPNFQFPNLSEYPSVLSFKISIALNKRKINVIPNYWKPEDLNQVYQRNPTLKIKDSELKNQNFIFRDAGNLAYQIRNGEFAKVVRIDLLNPQKTSFLSVQPFTRAQRRADL